MLHRTLQHIGKLGYGCPIFVYPMQKYWIMHLDSECSIQQIQYIIWVMNAQNLFTQ